MMSTLFFYKAACFKNVWLKINLPRKSHFPFRGENISRYLPVYICPLVNAFTAGVRDGLSYTLILTFEFVDEILWCYHSNETSSEILSHGTIYLVCSSNF